MEVIANEENIQEQINIYSNWNKLIIPSAESNHKKYFNILKYSLALMITVFGLISLWFSAQWQTENVLLALGIDITNFSSYVTTDDTFGNLALIEEISKFRLWDLSGSILNQSGVSALVAIGIIMMISLVPLLIFKNGTAWSIGTISCSLVLLIIVITLFSLGLSSQSNAIKTGSLPIDSQAQIDNLNAAIQDNKSLIKIAEPGMLLTPQEQMYNNNLNNQILILENEKNVLLNDFMPKLNEYLNLF